MINWDRDIINANKYYSFCYDCDHVLNSSNNKDLLEGLNSIHLKYNKDHVVEIFKH